MNKYCIAKDEAFSGYTWCGKNLDQVDWVRGLYWADQSDEDARICKLCLLGMLKVMNEWNKRT